ncbi:hypothetical protein BG003_003982 [Podila horticola]|nr:hypothetical protein BG003_003982 [Podila horticola]
MTDNLMRLFCLVNGEPTSNAFPVEIKSTKTIGDLKDLIKTKKTPEFDDIAADKLTLWRVTIPITDDDNEIPILLNNITSDRKKFGPKPLTSFVNFFRLKGLWTSSRKFREPFILAPGDRILPHSYPTSCLGRNVLWKQQSI